MRTILIAALALAVAACSPVPSSGAQAASEAAASALPEGGAATAAGVAGAEAFLREALAKYASLAANAASQADEAAQAQMGTAPEFGRLFSPALAEKLIRDSATTDGIGIGIDPICMCNDGSAMVMRAITSAPQPDGRVLSMVTFDSFDASGTNYPSVLVYSLEQTPEGWRIAEVVDRRGEEDDVSLVQTLELQ